MEPIMCLKVKKKRQADSAICLLLVAFLSISTCALAQVDSVRMKEMNAVFREQDFDKKAALFKDYRQKWGTDANGDSEKVMSRMYGAMARAAMRANNIQAFDEYTTQASAPDVMLNAEFAQKLVTEKKYPADAKRYAAVAYNETKKGNSAITQTAGMPDSVYQQLVMRKNYILAKSADAYAQACYQAGDYATGLPVAKEAAVTLGKSINWNYNEHYAMLLAKAAPVNEAKTEMEKLMRAGMLNDEGQAALKEVYVKEHNTDKGFDSYLQKLKAVANSKTEEALKRQWLFQKAPAFTLSKLEKGSVSLAQLKGKVVVLDFWATWCIPCVASFPAMQKVVDKYKNDPAVVFLFVDTKEQLQNIEAVRSKTQKFLQKDQFSKLTFNFVLDNDEKVADAYGVKMIPAKYVIDANGIIRFKATGFSGSADDLVAELSQMIEMAKKNK